MGWIVGIDTGGTFTDLSAVNHETGETFITKVSSTPSNPADAIISALDRFAELTGVSLAALDMLAHGTTVATNALLEGKGVKAGLLITEGFSAVYPAKGGTRPTGGDLIDPSYTKPDLVIPLRRTFGIPERITFEGKIRHQLDEAAVRHAARMLREMDVEAVAICFLFSFLNQTHEKRAAEIFRAEYPECRISLSSEVYPVVREYVRLSTVALDAYIGPVVQRYLDDLSARTGERGIENTAFFIMQSHGGLMRIDVAAKYPNETLLSGPAAGVAYSRELGRVLGEANLVTFDMGGTSTDICLISNGRTSMTRQGQIAGQDIGTPMIEIETLGAGGGAIAFVDRDGYLKVGPESAGAFPGPACYGLGGTRPTVTDANVVLGYVDPSRFAGGNMVGRRDLAEAAVARLGAELGLSTERAAIGIRRVVNSYMMSGVRLHASKKGQDLRTFSLLAFGGAGPLHAAELGEELGVAKIIIPAHPGLTCATGLLLSDVKHLYLQSYPASLATVSLDALEACFAGLMARAIEDAETEGFPADRLIYLRQIDVRYKHQGYDLTIDVEGSLSAEDDRARLRAAFDAAHQATYGLSAAEEEAEVVTLRLQSIASIPHMSLRTELNEKPEPAPTSVRDVYCPKQASFLPTPVFDRHLFGSGMEFSGPLIVQQLDSTIVVGSGQKLAVDRFGTLHITRL